MRLLLPVVFLVTSLATSPSYSDDYETVWIDTGTSVDVYWEVNLSGKVYVSADIDGVPACLDYWWIVWPLTQIKELGTRCGRATFEVPGISDFGVGGKLRAGNASKRTRVMGTSNEVVAHSFPVPF